MNKTCELCQRDAVEGERFCLSHRAKAFKAMRDDNYLTRVEPRPYFTPDMDDPWPGFLNITEDYLGDFEALVELDRLVSEVAGASAAGA